MESGPLLFRYTILLSRRDLRLQRRGNTTRRAVLRQTVARLRPYRDAMKHASEPGALPANVAEQRTRVFVHSDAPRHTGTVEYAGAYFGSGVDNSLSMDRFKRDFKVEVKSLDEEEMVFDMIGIDPAIANAFRRILLSEVPTMAIEKVFLLNNTSMIQDEMLCHRLGLIPIRADPRFFKERTEEEADEHNVIAFRLKVRCKQDGAAAAAAAAGGGEGEATLVESQVLSSHLEWIPQGDQGERFSEAGGIRPVHPDILVAKLRPGQEIHLEAWCEKGIGKTHAKWSPVATASYRLLPELSFAPAKAGAKAAAAASSAAEGADASPPPGGAPRPVAVFDVDAGSALASPAARPMRPRPCKMRPREASAKEAGWEERVKMSRIKDHFIFSIESTGVLPPEVLFQEAVKVLMQKANDISEVLKDAVMGQASSSDP